MTKRKSSVGSRRIHRRAKGPIGAGLGVDFSGGPTVDPTENVKDLSEALSQRQDDLREANNIYLDARFNGMQAITDMKSQFIQQIGTLRAEHAKEILQLNNDRLEKIRQVDITNATSSAASVLAAVQALAAKAAVDADTLRNALATTAAAVQNQTDRVVAGITERLQALEKSSYTGAGKSSADDPAFVEMRALVTRLATNQTQATGKSEGFSTSWAILLGAVALVGGLFAISSKTTPQQPTAPQVVYIPAPQPAAPVAPTK